MAQDQTPSVTGRVERWLELEVVEPMADFQDPSQEWRRLFSELSGRSSWCWSPPAAA